MFKWRYGPTARNGRQQRARARYHVFQQPIDENTKLNIEFLEAMPDEEAEKYRGEWIAVAGGRIVAHGKDPETVHEKGCDANRGVPHMEYIYASPEVPWLYIPKE